MNKNAMVSVIIPSYNHEKFIEKCILSILNQSFTDFELLIADDCSTDSSREKIQGIKDSRITSYFFEENVGTVQTLNFLISKCKGKYIAIIGSDDLWEKDKLKLQVEFMESNINYGACFTWANIIDDDDIPYIENDSINNDIFCEENKSQGEWLKRFYNDGNHLCHSSVLIRNDVQHLIGEYNPGYKQLHDYDFWIRLVNEYPIHIIKNKLVNYRRCRDTSKSVSGVSKENTIRLINENNNIIYNMFNIMKDDILISGFLTNNKELSNEEIICEKYFLLRDYQILGNNTLSIAHYYLMNNLNSGVVECLRKNYNFNIKDFYADTGLLFNLYPGSIAKYFDSNMGSESILAEIEHKDRIINGMTSSLSWRITKPLRAVNAIIGKKKK